jgi:Icc-related predicted phosphoesterase
MRFLLVSDLHYALQQYDWTAAVASEFDAVVIAGDHLDGHSAVDGSVQIVVLLKVLARMVGRTRLLVSSGNHDLDTRDGGGERVAKWMERVRALGIATDGDSIVIPGANAANDENGSNRRDTLVTVCPWWDGERARKKVGGQISADFARKRADPTIGTWAWVYHAPPTGSPTCWDGKKHYGDAALIKWIEFYQPDLVFTGHIHQAPFQPEGSWIDRIGKTWIFNSGRQIGPTPAHVVVDTGVLEAAWFSLAGAQSASLAQPLARPLPPLTAPPAWLPSLNPGSRMGGAAAGSPGVATFPDRDPSPA